MWGDLSTAAVVSRKVKCPAVADGSIPTICAVWLDGIVCDIYHRACLDTKSGGSGDDAGGEGERNNGPGFEGFPAGQVDEVGVAAA